MRRPKRRTTKRRGRQTTTGGFKKHSTRVTTSSKKTTYRTPKKIIKLCKWVFNGIIGLDPSADRKPKHQFAKLNFDGSNPDRDGLVRTWRGFKGVYCNPPYGRVLRKWIEKALRFAKKRDVMSDDALIMLIPARCETVWFQERVLPYVDAFVIVKGRLTFRGQEHGAPFASMLLYFGTDTHRFYQAFEPLGWAPLIQKFHSGRSLSRRRR